jgi:hypothetical protein
VKAQKYCLVTNSIKTDIIYNPDVVADMPLQKVI